MKNSIYLFLFAILLSVSACNSGTKTPEETLEPINNNSNYYTEVVKKTSGDFAGFSLNDTYDDAQDNLNSEYLSIEEDEFLLYKISDTYTITEYSLYFSEDGMLSEINMDTKVYDEEDNYDTDGAVELFNDIKEEFMEKFGSKYLEEQNEENIIMFWSKDEKQIQLILDQSEVHVYIESSML